MLRSTFTMKTQAFLLASTILLAGGLAGGTPLRAADQPSVRLLVVTGGHGYDTNDFRALFAALPGVEATFAVHPEAHAWLRPERAAAWDVLVLYDMWQPISDQARTDFLERLIEGKGLVALHHSLANHQDWPLYSRIVGGKYHLKPWEKDGQPQPGSTYQHDVDIEVQVLNPWHPVTRGLADFTIRDETYGRLEIQPTVQPLLAARHPTSNPVVAWCQTWHNTRVVGIQLGHDRHAYEHPAYRRLLANAIHWVAPPRSP